MNRHLDGQANQPAMLSGHPLLPPLPATGSSSMAAKYWIRSADEPKLYHPEPVLDLASRMTLQGLGFGLLVSCVQNALQEHNKGAMGVFTRTGGTIAFFGALGAAFSTTRAVTANIRETNDGINGASGGCAAGFVAGLRGGSLPMAVGSCIFLGTMVGTFEAAGNSLTGYNAAGLDRNQKEARRAAFFKKEPIGQ